jgi:hypothetical protein
MLMAPLISEDCFFELSLWCSSPRDVVALWIALCFSRHGIKEDSRFWIRFMRSYWTLRDRNKDEEALDAALFRSGLRLDSLSGLKLLGRLCIERKCSRSGCLVKFREVENLADSCWYHHGKLRKGVLTCCKASSFRSKRGCKSGFHMGSLFEEIFRNRDSVSADQKEFDVIKFPTIITPPPAAVVTTNRKFDSLPPI